jgi:hypothetical protein
MFFMYDSLRYSVFATPDRARSAGARRRTRHPAHDAKMKKLVPLGLGAHSHP